MRILIIEDEIKTAAYLAKGLAENDFIVDTAYDGLNGLYLANEFIYDLVILDVMLPKLDGWFVITELRRKHADIRVLFLTGRDAVHDKIRGFELGADDYLIKPFAFSELLARVKALLRRSVVSKNNLIILADLEIDLLKHKVKRQQKIIELTSQEFKLLLYLAEHIGEVLSRTCLAEAVWDINFNTETNVVDAAIKRLRQKIDNPFEDKLIHTLRGIGYVFEKR